MTRYCSRCDLISLDKEQMIFEITNEYIFNLHVKL